MRILCPIDKTVQKQKIQFKDSDLLDLLFYRKLPLYTIQPFLDSVDYRLKYTPIVVRVRLFKDSEITYENLSDIIYKVGNTELYNKNAIFTISTLFTDKILISYREVYLAWEKFVFDNMKRICETEISLLQWQCFSSGVTSILGEGAILDEQKYWILVNSRKDKDFWVEFSLKMRESLLPFINNKLWTDLEKRKNNKRENVDYNIQKEEMYDGSFNENKVSFDVDKVISAENYKQVDIKDLDIIK